MGTALFSVDYSPPWLLARFARPMRTAGWSLNRPGFGLADKVAWLEVRNSDLPLGVDPLALLEERLAERDWPDALGLMTACDVRYYQRARRVARDVVCEVLVTLGLGNAVAFDKAGAPLGGGAPVGTINTLIALSTPLTDGAMMELISIAATARTAALLQTDGRTVGTGTDCLVIAAPPAKEGRVFAGLHTEIGQAAAAATFQAVRQAHADWLARQTSVCL